MQTKTSVQFIAIVPVFFYKFPLFFLRKDRILIRRGFDAVDEFSRINVFKCRHISSVKHVNYTAKIYGLKNNISYMPPKNPSIYLNVFRKNLSLSCNHGRRIEPEMLYHEIGNVSVGAAVRAYGILP